MEKNKSIHAVEVTKNIVEILALILSAYWAFFVYKAEERRKAPSLKHTLDNSIQLSLDSIPGRKDICRARYLFASKNSGLSSVDIDSFYIGIWYIPHDSLFAGIHFDHTQYIQNHEAVFGKRMKEEEGELAPEDKLNSRFEFFLPTKRDSGVVIAYTLFYHRGSEHRYVWGYDSKVSCIPEIIDSKSFLDGR